MSDLVRLEELVARLAPERLEVTLEFLRRPDGTKQGRVVVRDAAGRTLADLPQASPEATAATLARLVEAGFRQPAQVRAAAPVPRVAADVLVAGVDGYRKG